DVARGADAREGTGGGVVAGRFRQRDSGDAARRANRTGAEAGRVLVLVEADELTDGNGAVVHERSAGSARSVHAFTPDLVVGRERARATLDEAGSKRGRQRLTTIDRAVVGRGVAVIEGVREVGSRGQSATETRATTFR